MHGRLVLGNTILEQEGSDPVPERDRQFCAPPWIANSRMRTGWWSPGPLVNFKTYRVSSCRSGSRASRSRRRTRSSHHYWTENGRADTLDSPHRCRFLAWLPRVMRCEYCGTWVNVLLGSVDGREVVPEFLGRPAGYVLSRCGGLNRPPMPRPRRVVSNGASCR